MLKFIKFFFQRFLKSDEINNTIVKSNPPLAKPKEKMKIVHKSLNIHKINTVSTDKKHKLLKLKVEIKTVHIHVNKKENIIVKFFQENGLELENEERSGKYSAKLLDHYQDEFSSLGYEIKVYNHLTNKNDKPKITINKKSKKPLKVDQLQKPLGLYEIGIVQWFDDQLGYGFINSRQNIDFFVHKRQLGSVKIVQTDVVIFKCEKNEKGNFAEKVLLLTNSKKSLVKFVEFNDKYRKTNKDFFTSQAVKNICQNFFYSTYLNEISEESFINMIFSCGNDYNIIQIIDHYVEKNKTISSSLEKILIGSIRDENLTYFLKSKNLSLFLKSPKIIDILNTFPSFIKKKYEKWTTHINEAIIYDHINVTFYPDMIYNSFRDTDYFLARQWVDKSASNPNFEYARMLSARGAELAALNFYKTLNFNVSDTAMSQVNHSSQDWKLFDLLLNNTKSIDVKNSRGVINERLSYSEHCIQRFKKNRNGEDVTILGVISPYLKMLENENKLDCSNLYGSSELENSIIVLGETSHSIINDLSKNLSGRKYLELDRQERSFIPDWLFEYPKEFYKKREHLKESFKNDFKEHPNLNEYKILDINVIPFFLGNGIRLPTDWEVLLSPHQLNFYNRLRRNDNEIITKPFLYLVLLSHFIERLRQNNVNNYSPYDYLKLIYYDDRYEYPLSIYDPTLIIKKLIDALDSLWQYRNEIEMQGFISFKYTEKGILKAKPSMSRKWYTLLAYCGNNYIEGKGPCGFKPLIKGKHSTCNVCGYIICPKCDFCKKDYQGIDCVGIEERRIIKT